MGPYIRAVSKAVGEIVDQNRNRGNSLKFGLIVYRDYVDDNNRYGSYKLEQDLTTEEHLIKAAINEVIAFSDPGDKDKAEAQYNGLIKGLSDMNIDPEESNILVLIGMLY